MVDLLRTVRLEPFRKGAGPTYRLYLYDTNKTDSRGRSQLAYKFVRYVVGYAKGRGKKLKPATQAQIIFQGDDFYSSPMHAIDSDETVKSLMTFITLRPGDTDREYFQNYNQEQLLFAQNEAEYVAGEVYNKFGE
jgi:hypothetical protein